MFYIFIIKNKERLNTCIELLARYKRSPFLQFIVTGDKTWVYYENPTQKKHWLSPGTSAPSQPKRNLHPKKALLCVCWDQRGILHYELLQEGQTINADRYSAQLRRLSTSIAQKRAQRDGIILLHDNAKPHVARSTRRTQSTTLVGKFWLIPRTVQTLLLLTTIFFEPERQLSWCNVQKSRRGRKLDLRVLCVQTRQFLLQRHPQTSRTLGEDRICRWVLFWISIHGLVFMHLLNKNC